ncbi:hypothetical protein B0H14DRAFT_2583682 [Mycena olivaceomarginata]|nr:hypothetical protein B0H14DRAFT_2583682 [Mycena olivaceomarginata]
MGHDIHPPTRGGIRRDKGEEARGDVHEYSAHLSRSWKGSVGEEYTKEARIQKRKVNGKGRGKPTRWHASDESRVAPDPAHETAQRHDAAWILLPAARELITILSMHEYERRQTTLQRAGRGNTAAGKEQRIECTRRRFAQELSLREQLQIGGARKQSFERKGGMTHFDASSVALPRWRFEARRWINGRPAPHAM